MTNRSFTSVFAFYGICVLITLEVVKAQDSFLTEYIDIPTPGEIGIKIKYDPRFDTRLNVVILYETETTPATDFFQKQLTVDLYKKITDCGVVYWNFMPCATSKLNNNALSCTNGEQQCKFDKIHACVATLYKKDEQKVGQFVTCFFVNNKDINKCVADSGLVQTDIDQCVTNEGANDCDAFNKIIHCSGTEIVVSPGISPGAMATEGISNFKKVLCDCIAHAKLQCAVCSP